MAQYDGLKGLLKSRTKWEKIRHPWAGVMRVILVLTLPIALWSHNALEVITWIIVALIHPGFFPAYVVAGKDAPILTRLADAVQQWHDLTPPNERTMDILPSTVPGAAAVLRAVAEYSVLGRLFLSGDDRLQGGFPAPPIAPDG